MSEAQKRAAQRRHRRESETICPTCDGSGLVMSQSARARSVKGGNHSYRKSLEPGQLSMSERGKRGGRPRALRISDLDSRDGHPPQPEEV